MFLALNRSIIPGGFDGSPAHPAQHGPSRRRGLHMHWTIDAQGRRVAHWHAHPGGDESASAESPDINEPGLRLQRVYGLRLTAGRCSGRRSPYSRPDDIPIAI